MNKITLTNDQLKRVFEVAQSTIAKDETRRYYSTQRLP